MVMLKQDRIGELDVIGRARVHIPQLIYLPVAWNLRSIEWFRYGVKEHVKSFRNCDLCGECEEKCPYHLPIREMIAENIKFYESVSGGKV